MSTNIPDEDMKFIYASMNFVANYTKKISKELNIESITGLMDEIIDAKRIFLIGAGRSGLEARAFSMRLMHLGFDVHIVGNVTAPVSTSGDLVIIVSGSGETLPVVNLASIIKEQGPKLVTITINKNSTLGKMSEMVIVIPIKADDIDKELREYILPLGTLFEVIVHIFLDAIISQLKCRTKTTEATMKDRHLFSEYVGMI